MHDELTKDGHGGKFEFIAINSKSAVNNVTGLTNSCDFPVYQDLINVDAWKQHDGGKDDMYIYDQAGVLTHFLPIGGALSINLSGQEGYSNVKNAVLSVLGNQ